MIKAAIVLAAVFVAWFIIEAKPRVRVAVLLAFLFPGAGHLYLGRRPRAFFLGGMVLATFLAGMAIADFRNISLDRHPVWALAHAFGGLMSAIAGLSTRNLMIEGSDPLYPVGCLYSGVACLMNMLVMIDAYDLARKDAVEAATSPSSPEGEA